MTTPNPILIEPQDARLLALEAALTVAKIRGIGGDLNAGTLVSAADAFYGWLTGPAAPTRDTDDDPSGDRDR